MMNKKAQFSNLILSFLFFSTIIVWFIFIATDIEYNLNQQIARGYISRDAVFFEIDNPSYKTDIIGESVSWDDGSVETHITDGATIDIAEDGSMVVVDEYIEAVDPDFVLINSLNENGLTSIETILSSYDDSYFASLHSGTLRGVYYAGDIALPPLIHGDFFTSEECLCRTPLAVVGNNYKDLIYESNGKSYIDFFDKQYEVRGIAGLSGDSPLDNMVFVNIGSLTPEEQLNGMYYIDSSSDNLLVYDYFSSQSQDLLGCDFKLRDIPTAQIDTVSGGMYLKTYLYYIMFGLLILTYINILIQNLKKNISKIDIMKIIGVSNIRVLLNVVTKSIRQMILGCIIGIACIFLLLFTNYFSLPLTTLLKIILSLCIGELIMTIVWVSAYAIAITFAKPKEVLQRI